jgi:hypothetical protein
MKRRVRKIANFFAFNLLFFALYLNFIHKDNVAAANPAPPNTTAFSGTTVVESPVQKAEATTAVVQQPVNQKEDANSTALRLSIN